MPVDLSSLQPGQTLFEEPDVLSVAVTPPEKVDTRVIVVAIDGAMHTARGLLVKPASERPLHPSQQAAVAAARAKLAQVSAQLGVLPVH